VALVVVVETLVVCLQLEHLDRVLLQELLDEQMIHLVS
jgi:hypothetical protein